MDEAARDQLVAALRQRGVDYLAPSDARGEPLDDAALIAALGAHDDPRLRQALIALFLVHPELASLVPALRAGLPEPAATELLAHYMAAVYLRRMWATRLSHYLPGLPPLPDLFSKAIGLPAPDAAYGKEGLYSLADWHQRTVDRVGSRLQEYFNAAELLFGRLALKAEREPAAARHPA